MTLFDVLLYWFAWIVIVPVLVILTCVAMVVVSGMVGAATEFWRERK